MRLRVKIILICIWMCCLSANAARQSMDKIFAQWSNTPSQTLLDNGRASLSQGKIRNAMVMYSTVANRYYQENVTTQEQQYATRAMNNIGYIYFYCYYDYQKAYSYLHQAQRISEEKHFMGNLAYIYLNLANLYLTMSEAQPTEKYFAPKPLEYYRKAFQCAVEAKKWDVLQVIYNNLLLTAFTTPNMKIIQKERQQFSQLRFPVHTPLVEYNRWTEKAMQARLDHQYQKALAYLQKAQQAVNTEDTPERYVYSTIGLEIQIYELLHDTPNLMRKFREMTNLVNKYDIKDLKVEHYKQLYDYYTQVNKRDSASRYETLYFKAKDALVTDSRLQVAGEMHFLSELQDANDKMRILAAQHRQQQIITMLCIILVVMSILSALYFVRKNKELRRKQQALYEKMQEILTKEDEARKAKTEEAKLTKAEAACLSKTDDAKQAKYLNSKLGEEDKKQIFEKIQSVMADISIICSSDFTLRLLAEQVGKPYAEVSQVINEMAGKNFNAFLGECRVKEACRRLSDVAQYGHLTIEAISASVGFKSRTNFVAIFKKVTGLTPSEYQRSAKLQNATKNA